MCLGVPGEIVAIEENPLGMTMGTVSFGGIRKQVCLAYVPEAVVGDHVIVHVGFALHTIDSNEAQRVFRDLERIGELADELGPAPDDGTEPEST